MPLYGDGLQEREWLFIDDLVSAVRFIAATLLASGLEVVHVGSGQRVTNMEIARRICELSERPLALIRPVLDRPGHDRRYALDCSRLRARGWAPKVSFEDGLARTVAWYLEHGRARAQADAGFAGYFQEQYGKRLR